MSDPLLIVIVGPTGSGKTALSLALAERFGGEIISCDSVAVYRDFEIGTAKPSLAERRRIPHHLIDVVSPEQPFTAGDYSRLARAAAQGIAQQGKLPIVVGGTGLYLRAFLEGLFAGPSRSEELRERLRASTARRGPGYLHKLLARLDPSAAASIHENDEPKLIRAVEVCLAARRPITEMWKQGRDPLRGFCILRVGIDPERSALYERLNARAQDMFKRGLLEETESLVQRYCPRLQECDRLTGFRSLGYRQCILHLRGEIPADETVRLTQQGHRNYAKRQMTWFRREPDVRWIQGFGDDQRVQQTVQEIVAATLTERNGSGTA
jgi:tRNA dimethylallyltransferase